MCKSASKVCRLFSVFGLSSCCLLVVVFTGYEASLYGCEGSVRQSWEMSATGKISLADYYGAEYDWFVPLCLSRALEVGSLCSVYRDCGTAVKFSCFGFCLVQRVTSDHHRITARVYSLSVWSTTTLMLRVFGSFGIVGEPVLRLCKYVY